MSAGEDVDDDGPKSDEEDGDGGEEDVPRDKGKGRGSPGASVSPPSTPSLLPRTTAPTPVSSFEDIGDFFLDGVDLGRGDAQDVLAAEGSREVREGEPRTPEQAAGDDGETGRGRKRLRVCPPTPPRAAVPVTVRRSGTTAVTPLGLLSRTRPATQARPRALPGPTPQGARPRRMVPGFEFAHSLAAFNEEVRRRTQATSIADDPALTPSQRLAAIRDQHPLPVYTSSDEELWAAVPDLPLQELGEMCDRMFDLSD